MREFSRMTPAESHDSLDSDAIDVWTTANDLADPGNIVITDIVIVVDEGDESATRSPNESVAFCPDGELAIIAIVQNLDGDRGTRGVNLCGQPFVKTIEL